jgi:hypothetical protein
MLVFLGDSTPMDQSYQGLSQGFREDLHKVIEADMPHDESLSPCDVQKEKAYDDSQHQ